MCNGTIESFDQQTVTFTGKVSVRGRHETRNGLEKLMLEMGIGYSRYASSRVSLLVHGDLTGQCVVDEWNEHSRKLIFVRSSLSFGRHICVTTSRGFSDLLDGATASCQTRLLEQATCLGA